jgi:uracil-DNA glycosylase
MDVRMESSWKQVLHEEFDKPYFVRITEVIKEEKRRGQTIYPPGSLIFNAFEKTPFDRVKCVILGQDPYHGPGQAHGLCFSTPAGVPAPPSLVNIFKELHADTGLPIPRSGNLEKWAESGVLLLNTILTVQAGQAASHSKIGWEQFTDAVIGKISDLKTGIVFLLWGRYAQSKKALIDASRHHILASAHPSPLSASGGFFGTRPFSRSNELLLGQGTEPVDWRLE